MAESSGDILERVGSLQVISLQEAISGRGALGTVSDLIIVKVDGLKSHDGVVLVDPNIHPDYQWLCVCWPLSLILEGTFPTDAPTFLLDACEGAAPFLRL